MGGKSTTQETTQTNSPPEWAEPLFKQAAGDAQALYDSKTGLNTYTGPTVAPKSDVTLSGMNNMLAATGYTGTPVTNESIMANVPDVNAIMAQVLAGKQKPALPAAVAPAQEQKTRDITLWETKRAAGR